MSEIRHFIVLTPDQLDDFAMLTSDEGRAVESLRDMRAEMGDDFELFELTKIEVPDAD